ncbi:hypothetical protein MKX03_032245 [Papaver bracteatum]|nr:hypothetical protein MKX03_032245 [Papaver bracteatum]
MVQYNFKKIRVVPNGKEFVNITLYCTHCQTPTVIYKGYAINRIRQFYMRKNLSSIVDDFPRMDDIHPFYGDLLHMNSARRLISKIAKDYLKFLKYRDLLYTCKYLKVDALGQMLPSIDLNTKTILICGYPNVGKSFFINKITRANVDVHPYAFTIKSLFVIVHTNYKCLRYQVIDTPRVLDRPFEDRNIIEMCSITSLAHLRVSVLFFLDISGSCGYNISQQETLFHIIKSLFVNKPLTMVCNKTDLYEMKDEDAKTKVGEGGEPSDNANVILTMITFTEDGVISVKNAVCEKILNQRVELKMNSKKITDYLNRFHVGIPNPRYQKERPHYIPQSFLEFKAKEANENGGGGVYTSNLKKHYILEHDEWKEDIMPEILDGHNVHDFVDIDTSQRLEELEQEEGLRLEDEEIGEDFEMDDGKELTPEEQEILPKIKNNPSVPALGLNPSCPSNRLPAGFYLGAKRGTVTKILKLGVAVVFIVDNHANKKLCSRCLSRPRSRSNSKPPGEVVPGEGFKNRAQKVKALKLARNSSKKRNKQSRVGEADRVVANLKPKHLFSGNRSNGKANRR